MKSQSYSFFRGSDFLRIEAVSLFLQAFRLTKQCYTTTQKVVSSLQGSNPPGTSLDGKLGFY